MNLKHIYHLYLKASKEDLLQLWSLIRVSQIPLRGGEIRNCDWGINFFNRVVET